jgi:F-type H+-transporting ATPase subunit delta
MGILAQHVPSIEQLKPGLVEIIEESGGSKQFFRTSWLLRSSPIQRVRAHEQGY